MTIFHGSAMLFAVIASESEAIQTSAKKLDCRVGHSPSSQ